MKVSISTIKQNKVFLVMCLDPGVSKEQFSQAVQNHFLSSHNGVPYSFYAETHDDTLAMIVILDVNSNPEAPQQEKEI